MNRQRLHLTLGLRYFEIQLGILISFCIFHSPHIDRLKLNVCWWLDCYLYLNIHAQYKDISGIPLQIF